MWSRGTPKGMGDYDPPDDRPVAGVDYDACAWCPGKLIYDEDGKITGFSRNIIAVEDAVICDGDDGPEHYDSCPDGITEWALWACKDCHAEGLTEFHPDHVED